jgi:ubiquinone/menaquinone biosynthesis C-methylase UbiE
MSTDPSPAPGTVPDAPIVREDHVERAVRERYSAAALTREPSLCCPVEYDRRLLEAIPAEVIERDYGCGDPSRHVAPGDRVLDLGSGGGKACFIASQLVGRDGEVIGVDTNDEMLALARSAAPSVAERIGYANVRFLRGQIQDLALPGDSLAEWLERNPVHDLNDLARLEAERARLRAETPLIPDESVDIVISNCVLNLVHNDQKLGLVSEIQRVLRPGGRIALSDIVSDEPVPESLRADSELWSGCISGAFHEHELLQALERAGFLGLEIERWEERPFAVVDGIEFRSVTMTGIKGGSEVCREANQAVIYRGPWKQVEDDDGHVLVRGERAAVCDKTFGVLTRAPYAAQIIPLEPHAPIAPEERPLFDCARSAPRHPRETKGADARETRPYDDPSCC